ncbi:unnamed protein product [Effrenium voratum]|uniref:Uncharacterized protein n=1 Tax=Effrenium voratum TaxID=2562239 RepID=A0AA36JQ85_9DINO|nr:unnamed protein product [Effrenium voratum]
MTWALTAALTAALPCAAEMELTLAEAMPGPVLPPCDNWQISVLEECPNATLDGLSWPRFQRDLYAARAEVFGDGLAEATRAVWGLVAEATANFSQAFACPGAVVSGYFTLARLLAQQGRKRRALAMLHLGFIFVRDRGFSECSTWPAAGWDVMLAGQVLTERVRQLDDGLRPAAGGDVREAALRVAVVTICAYAEDEPVRVLCAQNRRLYQMLHGYDLHFFTDASQIQPNVRAQMDVKDGVHKPFFWKVNAVKNVLDTGNYDWVLWIDCDAFFMDPTRTIDSVIAMYSNLSHLPQPGEDASAEELEMWRKMWPEVEVSLILAVDSTGINNGVWLLKNTFWSHEFLQRWWRSDILQGPGKDHNCSDQSTMLHALLQERALRQDGAELWDAYEAPIYPPEVRVARQEHLQSFHQATAQSALSRAWQDGDFIKHHPGCHYYKAPCQQLYQEAQDIFWNKVLLAQSWAEDIKKNGMSALEKYWGDEKLMAKISKGPAPHANCVNELALYPGKQFVRHSASVEQFLGRSSESKTSSAF